MPSQSYYAARPCICVVCAAFVRLVLFLSEIPSRYSFCLTSPRGLCSLFHALKFFLLSATPLRFFFWNALLVFIFSGMPSRFLFHLSRPPVIRSVWHDLLFLPLPGTTFCFSFFLARPRGLPSVTYTCSISARFTAITVVITSPDTKGQ